MALRTLALPDAFREAGLLVRTVPGWQLPRNQGYIWREPDSNPAGIMWHHTATRQYTPNRDKANMWVGFGVPGSDRLTSEDYGDASRPRFVFANAYPAPISSGYGVRSVLEDYVKMDHPYVGRAPWMYDPNNPKWAGNTHYWNIEVVLDGVGDDIEPELWDCMVVAGQVMDDVLFGMPSPARHITHSMHTTRKVDLYDGSYVDASETVVNLRRDMEAPMSEYVSCPWQDEDPNAIWFHEEPPCTRHFTNGQAILWGQNTGVCNVPPWGEKSTRNQVTRGVIVLSDNGRDDFNAPLKRGEWWTFADRGNPHPS